MSECENIIKRLKELGFSNYKVLGQAYLKNNSVCTQTKESIFNDNTGDYCLELDKR